MQELGLGQSGTTDSPTAPQPSSATLEQEAASPSGFSTPEATETPTDNHSTPEAAPPISPSPTGTDQSAPASKGDEDRDSTPTASIVGGGVAAVIACLTALVGAIMYHRKKRRARAANKAAVRPVACVYPVIRPELYAIIVLDND